MKVTVLGSGAWEGIPALFCSCRVCVLAANPTSKDYRTRPQFLVTKGHRGFLLEAGPDIRTQTANRHLSMIKDFVISHWHFDHMYGLHEMLTWSKSLTEKPTIFCSPETQKVLSGEFSYLPLTVKVVQPFEPFRLSGINITPLPVCHMRLRDEGIRENALQNSYAYLLEDEGLRIAYLGDYYSIPDKSLKKLRNLDAVIADGTYLLIEKFKKIKPNHIHGKNIIKFTKSLKAKKVFYHSISHLTRKTHQEIQAVLPKNHFATFDGMQIMLERS